MKDKLLQTLNNKIRPIYSNLYRLLRKTGPDDLNQEQRDSYIGLIHQNLIYRDFANNHWLFGDEGKLDDETKSELDTILTFMDEHDQHIEKLKALTEDQRQILYKEQAKEILDKLPEEEMKINKEAKHQKNKLQFLANKDHLTFEDKYFLDSLLHIIKE